MATTRIKKTLTAIPASVAEAMAYLVSIGRKQLEINKEKSRLKADTEKLKAEAQKKIDTLTTDRDNFFTALFAFASPRKAELTLEKRSQKTAAGTFGWRWTTPYVELADGVTDEMVIKRLKASGLTKYIRIIEEVDREALLRDHPKIAGVSFVQRDEFFAKPDLGRGNGRAEELVKKGETEAIDV